MSPSSACTAAALAAALSCALVAPAPVADAPTGHATSPIYGLATNGDYAVVDAGSQAPDVALDTPSGWTHLSDLRGQGNVLLVIGVTDAQLAVIERERPALLGMGVVPVAVLDQRPNACRHLARALGLGFTLVPDARRVIGAQFNALDPASRADAPAWFVIDRKGSVRDLARGEWPSHPWTEVCAGALGLPAPDAPLPASFPR